MLTHGKEPTEAKKLFPNQNYQYNPTELWKWLLDVHNYEDKIDA